MQKSIPIHDQPSVSTNSILTGCVWQVISVIFSGTAAAVEAFLHVVSDRLTFIPSDLEHAQLLTRVDGQTDARNDELDEEEQQ